MKVSTKNIVHTSTLWAPRQGYDDSLARAVNPPWAGEQTSQVSSFVKALYPRPKNFRISLRNSITAQTQDVDLPLFSTWDINGNETVGYNSSGRAFTWTSGLFPLNNSLFPGGVIANCNAVIEPKCWTGFVGKNPAYVAPPIANPPINNYYVLFVYPPAPSAVPNNIASTIYTGNMYPDNQCPGYGIPGDASSGWTANYLYDMAGIAYPVTTYGINIIDLITVTDWEPIS